MSSEKIHVMNTVGPIVLELKVDNGAVNVSVDPKAVYGRVRVHTAADEGPVADAVNGTEFSEYTFGLKVVVPDDQVTGGGITQVVTTGRGGRSTFNFGGNSVSFGGGIVISGNNTSSVVSTGDDVWIGGRQVVAGGRVVAAEGTVVGGAAGTITVDVILPVGSSLKVDTVNAETTVRGDLKSLRFDARNGSLQAEGVGELEADTHNGSLLVDRVDTELDATTHNGSVTIGAYNGRRGSASTHNGDVTVSATPASSGKLSARTHNGNIRVRGAAHLDVRTSTHNGRVW